MKSFIGSFIGLVLCVCVGAEPLLEGRVRLESGEPVADAQVRIFDLSDLRQGPLVRAQTDGTGYFALPLAALAGSVVPERFTLGQNYPNPFNPSTIIPYQLAASSAVRLEVFNLLGQHLATLVDGERAAGFHTATWQATDGAGRAVGAGVYIYRMTVGVESQTGRMVLIDGQAGLAASGSASVWSGASGGGSAGEGSQVYGLVLANLTNLTFLNLQWSDITDISMLAGLTNLTELILLGNAIEDISPLAGLTNLTELVFANSAIEDISPLAGLTNLAFLMLQGSYISDITPLAGLTDLTRLDLRRNNIMDISPLASLTNLTWSDLRYNAIEDMSPLAGLTHLTWLGLRGNPLNLSSINDHIPVLEDRGATVQYDSFQEEGDYDIELVFLDSFPERDRRLLHWTARRWMAVIREDLPDYEFAQGWSGPCGDHSIEIPPGERIDDLRIYVISIEDGPLGWGGPDLLRETTHLPVVGCMAFDIARSNIPIIGLHEIGHVLGFGTIWDELGFFQNPPNGDQHFNGPLAIAAFDDAGGREYTGAKVPVSGGHWRESVFGQELMTYGGDLSAITIQSLADLGYAVDVTQADPYTLPGAAGKASAKVSAALPSTYRRLESAEWMGGRGFDFARRDNHLMGRLAPHPHTEPKPLYGLHLERKPMYVIDPQGYIIRTLGH